jgi:ABC-2 type transport system permease protein
MNKVWLVFKYEYLGHIRRKRFILTLFSLPLVIALVIAVGIITAVTSLDRRPVGYSDLSGLFANAKPLPEQKSSLIKPVEIIKFDSSEQAIQLIESGEIQGLFIIEKNYLESGSVTLIANEPLKGEAQSNFREFLVANLLTAQPENIREHLLEGPVLIFRSLTDKRQFNENNILGIIVPVVAGILLVIAINASGGYLLQAVSVEKENRTMEILVTSVSSNELMAGKIFGNLSVGLTQLVFWVLTGAGAIIMVMWFFPEVSGYGLDLSFLGLMIITFLPAFIMVSALMAMVGATAAEARDAQQIAGLFSIPIAFPLWFLPFILEQPNSPLAIILTFFPFSAPITLPMRGVLTTLPWWQIAGTTLLLLLCAIGAVLLASRAFRLGMLRYGKSLSLREIIRKERA